MRSRAEALLLAASVAFATGEARAAGTVLSEAPSVAPGAVAPDPTDPLELARQRWVEGDAAGVVTVLTPWLTSRKGPWGRPRTAAHLLMGEAQMQLENYNLASYHFYRVRAFDGPLAPYGAWYEALVDHRRGRHLVAIRECDAYRQKWPDGPQADECLLLMGDAWSSHGNRGAAVYAYQQYSERHPDTPRNEEIRLAVAVATARSAPDKGVALLRELVISHAYPSTDLAAQAALHELGQQGLDVSIPDDPRSRMRRAESLRRSGKLGEAWELFQLIAERGNDDPAVATWVEDNEDRFAWGTRQYDVFAEALTARYEAAPEPDLAWSIFVAWGRGGEWARAAEWGRKGLKDHATGWRWRTARDDVAWATMLAGEYTDAAARFAELTARGGEPGRRASFYSGFSSLRAGNAEAAVATFDKLLQRSSDWSAPALYWRSKAHRALGHGPEADADLAAAMGADHTGWYRLVAETTGISEGRDGTWPGTPGFELPPSERPEVTARPSTGLWPASYSLLETPWGRRGGLEAPQAPTAAAPAWNALRWDRVSQPSVAPPAAPSAPPELASTPLDFPDGYSACAWYDPEAAERTLANFAKANEDLWPDLPAAYDLATAGLYTESARLVFSVFEEWRDVRTAGAGDDPRRQRIYNLRVSIGDWRQMVLFTRDHYHAARTCYGLDKGASDEESRIAALRLAFPVVRPKELWQYGRDYDIDPFLMLAVMRQESTYRNTALSPTGAIGLVQVMPSTGAKVAALLGVHRYSPGDLEDPAVNLRYGAYYFSLLMRRFDNCFPLAVASYNGGPHNVSRWYRPWHEGIDLDAFVEQIQYDETRDYVKKVSGYYARYAHIYDAGRPVVLPGRPSGDDATIIDF